MATYPLRLAGWEEQSIIGSDDQMGGWFAQLWPNGATTDAPEAWLTAPSPTALAGRIVAATKTASGDVETAVHEATAGAGHQTESWQRP